MPFPFTFSFSVPGITNPFSLTPTQPPRANASGSASTASAAAIPNARPLRRRPSPGLFPPPEPLNRKRGWVPAHAEPSEAATVNALSSGYLDTPAKYRDMVNGETDEREVEEMIADIPPAKRRRTLAGTIVSTAVSAALIGTAVGLTVYRLWRDRGREPELAPPPYEQGSWVHPDPQEGQPPVTITPPTPRAKKGRHIPASSSRKAPLRHRRTQTRTHHVITPPPDASLSHSQPQFDFSQVDEGESEVEDKMDWVGGRLAQLIEEGKKALGKEVVVMSDAQEDEVDDGSGNWEEEELGLSGDMSSRRGSIRHKSRPQNLGLPSSYSSYLSPPPSSSPRRARFDTRSSPLPSTSALPIPGSMQRGTSVDSVRSHSSFHEDESQWQTPETREFMERARAAYLRNRS
ncbi:hypothetical protein EW146_g6558 [Bondarzewia mesenterica]|uniref:Uncharacterized protein n=1 Tax=Bondarzewia mesenterica TaxID=1095465 RepID=A0A4S4LN70_9AGAM|nr:hypothetical protein EW146_g6558 [Bondarzewia mesenterica]